MNRRMVINSIYPEECRIAIIDDGKLVELEIESGATKKLKGNIYKGKVSRIEPSLQAAFIDIGTSRNGFLQINDIHPSYYKDSAQESRQEQNSGQRRREGKRTDLAIKDLLYKDQELLVQVVKEERDMKGATLTTHLSLPGRYVVLMPGSERGGISRRISDSEQRQRLKQLTQEFELPAGIGVIIRTAGLDRSQTDLSRDLALQLKLWERLLRESLSCAAPTLLYKESDLDTRVVRDYFSPDIREIIVDNEQTYNQVKEFVGQVMPRYRSRVKLFAKEEPIFAHYNIEDAVNQTYHRTVTLPSGGAIAFDTLEALVAVDVNSGKATTEENIEETAFKTNLEAASEIARQLRLRDLGGLIVVDFIDMADSKHRAAVEKEFKEAVKDDKARIEIGRLSKFGLLEMSRQRLRASLNSQSRSTCSSCQGLGTIKNPELTALEALRKIHGAVATGEILAARVRLPPASALFLLNVKKKSLVDLEELFNTSITVIADGRLKGEEYEFEIQSRKSMDHEQRRALVEETPVRPRAPRDRGQKRKRRGLSKVRERPRNDTHQPSPKGDEGSSSKESVQRETSNKPRDTEKKDADEVKAAS